MGNERTALVARTGAWRAQRGNKRLPVCLVDLKSVEVFVQEHHAGLRRIPSRRESIAAAEYVAAERPAVNYLGDTYPMGSSSRRDAAVYHHWRSTTLERREHMNLLDRLGSTERALVARATARW